MNQIDNSMREFKYTNVQVNQPAKDEVFAFSFPIGTRIVDHIQKKVYRAGADVKDERKAIQSYMVSQGLKPEPAPASSSRRFLTLLGLFAIVLLVIGLVAFRRRRFRRTVAGCLLMLVPGECLAQSDLPQTSAEPERPTRMAQCGFRVSVFALEYFGVTDYRPEDLAVSLAPSPEGISLSAIQKTLEAHGLKVRPRQDISERELARALGPDRIAIVPVIYPKGYRHYLVAVDTARRGAVLVDVLGPVRALNDGLRDKRAEWYHRLALFVERPDKGARPAAVQRVIAFEPSELDFARVVLEPNDASALLPKQLTLHNTSRKPILVRNVSVSCGCMQKLSWKGGTIDAGEKREIRFEIIPGAWGRGVGREERAIFFTLADGSVYEFPVKGEVVMPEVKYSLKVLPESIRMNLDKIDGAGDLVREATIFFEAQAREHLHVKAESPWLSAKIEGVENNSARLILRIATKNICLSPSLRAEADVGVFSGSSKTRLRVIAFREKFYELTPDFLVLSLSKKESATIKIMPRRAREELEAVKTWSENAAVNVIPATVSRGGISLVIRPARAASQGPHRVFCRLKAGRGLEAIATIVVQLVP